MTFRRPEIFRPPSEHNSYYLPLTSGCSNSTCTFCEVNRPKLQLREVSEIRREIDAVDLFRRTQMTLPDIHPVAYAIAQGWDGKKLFLQDFDALVYPFEKLRDMLLYLNQTMPHIQRIACYATPQDVLRRTPQELEQLRKLKLSIFYMGVESGSDKVLEKVKKGVTRAQIIEAGKKVKGAGITLSVTVILGLDGVEGSQSHASETASILTELDPEYAGALTLTLDPKVPMYQDLQNGTFHPLSPFQYLEELRTMIQTSNFTDCFFSSMHASNYFALRGRLPREKKRMLTELQNVLEKKNPAMLRPEYMRGM